MNDIEVLERFRNYNKFYKEEDGKLTITIDLDLKTELDKAIENLLKERQGHEDKIGELEYKYEKALDDLIKYEKERQSDKDRIKELEEMLKNRIKYTNELEKDLFENASNYVVPKSLIKEKIEEIEQSMNKAKPFDISYIEYCEDRIQVLEELLNTKM